LTLAGYWPESGSWNSLIMYSFFVMTEVIGFIVGGVMLDSMMADVVEDSEVQTSRRSEGLFYAARSFASKAVSALGIILAGSIVSLVGMDGIKGVADMTDVMRGDLASFFLPAYCGLYFFAIYLISKYKIDREQHKTNLEALARKQ
jgi:GPH family glycoside/pentoside/hexuronide:cation symporter